ncbi:MAG: DinB family protein [Chloroflexota bacterium]|nr:DinB family protein [Chloroflexota bacterium]
MTTPETRRVQIEALRDLPDLLEAAIDGWTNDQLDYQPAADAWSARQIVHHLADSHSQAFFRIKLTLTEDIPRVKPYDQDAFANIADSRDLPLAPSLAILRGLHQRLVYVLERMSDADFERAYFHPEQERNVSLSDALTSYAEHGGAHIRQIAANRTAAGW